MTETIATKSVLVTVGWTKSDRDNGYVSYCDGYRTGAEQHTEDLLVEVPFTWDAEDIAWAFLTATNSPYVYPEGKDTTSGLLRAIYAVGYHGEGAHFSLSTGDTVTVGETTLAFTGLAVEKVTL